MASSKQMHHIATNPMAHMKFVLTGRLPAIVHPRSPLIDLLVKISPRDRIAIVGLTVNDALGYSGSRMFRSAEAALRWVRPDVEMLESQSWPARSWQNKRFAHALTLNTLLMHASNAPAGLLSRYPALCDICDQAVPPNNDQANLEGPLDPLSQDTPN